MPEGSFSAYNMWGEVGHFMEPDNEIGTEGDRTDAVARSALQVAGAERTNELAQAYEELKRAQAELQRRWQYLAEAQRLSHSGTFGWKVSSGELVWSDETYRILGFARETNPTHDLVFDRIHPDDLDRMREVKDRAVR